MTTKSKPAKTTAKIAVITRTKDREVMLRRVSANLQALAFKDFIWVVVNDGGDPAPVDLVVEKFSAAGGQVKVIHNETNLGMEAAANIGIRASQSEFIHIHDDDDSIQDGFYEKLSNTLDSDPRLKGVTANINRIFERFAKDKVTFIRTERWDTGVPSIARMVCINRFLPISFLYRRAVHDEIGYYNDELPVCGDWEFYLRFLRKYDIAKETEFLANYHIRETADDQGMLNSISSQDTHQRVDMEIRNRMIRDELDSGVLGYATLVVQGAQLWDTEIKLYHMNRKVAELERTSNELMALKTRVRDRLSRNFLTRWFFRT